MLLSDIRLNFARDLIVHWLDIRRGAVVPLEEDIDPRALLPCFDSIGIVDLAHPPMLTVELAGARVHRRFGRDIRHLDWVELVPPTLGDAGQRARARIRSAPCGFYHKFTVARAGAAAVTAETLVLPLRHRDATVPHALIGITSEVGKGAAGTPAGWLTPSAHVAQYFMEFVEFAT